MSQNGIETKSTYQHFVSLGYCCAVAQELERIGMRSTSSPFDWCITSFPEVLDAIQNGFEHFLDYDLLYQDTKYHDRYMNKQCGIAFVHDFDEYSSLKRQLPAVKRKYSRRIARLYSNIQEPTLFVRYISDEEKDASGRSAELVWIENNFKHLLDVLKSFNSSNDILFIANNGVISDIIHIWNVPVGEGKYSQICKRPFTSNIKLREYFLSMEYPLREKNLQAFQKKQNGKGLETKARILSDKIRRWVHIEYALRKLLHKEYIHEKQYS